MIEERQEKGGKKSALEPNAMCRLTELVLCNALFTFGLFRISFKNKYRESNQNGTDNNEDDCFKTTTAKIYCFVKMR